MRFMKLLLLVALLAFGARGVYAQFETASLVGKVTDSTGAVIPGATVTVTNTETGVAISRQTNDSGEYNVPALRNGVYRVVVTKDGFDSFITDNVNLAIGTNQRVDATMTVGNKEAVTVEASDLVLETETSQRQQIITTEQIEAFPIINLNYADLVTLSAGAMAAPAGEDLGTTSMTREASFNINGQRSTFNNYLLDGMDNNQHGTSNQGFSNQVINPPYASISQFSIVTTLPSAEYGRASGGTINTAFKQGTNKIHGQVYEYYRNTILNAPGWFKPAAGSDAGNKVTLNQNQFGGNIGGPIKHDRFFVFGDYEGYRRVKTVVNSANALTQSQHQFITSANTSVNTVVVNPFTGATYPSQRPLPVSVLSPIAVAITNSIPLPNNYINGYNSVSVNWVYLQRFTNSADKEDVRLDAQWTPRMSTFLRVSQSKQHALDGPSLPPPLEGAKNGYIRVINQQVALGLTRQIGSSQLLEARLGVSFTKGGKNPYGLGDPRTFGIKGLPTDPRVWGGLTTLSITGCCTYGRQSTNPQWQYPFFLNPKVSYSWLLGHHNFKVGYEMGYLRQSVQDVNPIYGSMSFASYSYNVYSDFWFGAPSELDMTTFYIAHIRQGGHSAYFQDDWKILPKLTLNLGVRYEYASHFYEKDNRLTNYDPVNTPITGQLIRASNGSAFKRQLIDPDYNDFAPRIGLSYSPISKMVIHAGYGIGYVHYTRSGEVDNLAVNAPQVNQRVLLQAPPYFTQTLIDQGVTPSPTFSSLDDGYPAGMADPANFDLYTSRVAYVPRNYRDPYVQSWYLGIQASVGKNRVIDIAYVGNHSVKLQQVAIFNQRNPDLGVVNGGPDKGLWARPYKNIGDVTMSYNNGMANYNGLQARFEQRNFHGITFLNSFTWSRELENVSGPLESSGGHSASSTDIYANQHKDYGAGNFDRPIVDVASLVWNLPIGRGKFFFKHAGYYTNLALGGWQISAISTYYDGMAMSPNSNLGSSNLPLLSDTGNVQYRPYFIDNTPYGRRVAKKRVYQPYFPDRIFCNSTYASNINTNYSGCTVQFNVHKPGTVSGQDEYNDPRGTVPNGFLRGPSRQTLDLTLNKTFNLPWQKLRLQFRASYYNVLNKTNFTNPGMSCCAASFGRINSTYDARQGQGTLKLLF